MSKITTELTKDYSVDSWKKLNNQAGRGSSFSIRAQINRGLDATALVASLLVAFVTLVISFFLHYSSFPESSVIAGISIGLGVAVAIYLSSLVNKRMIKLRRKNTVEALVGLHHLTKQEVERYFSTHLDSYDAYSGPLTFISDNEFEVARKNPSKGLSKLVGGGGYRVKRYRISLS